MSSSSSKLPVTSSLCWAAISHHLDALLLALASSTDNFTVGLAVGIRQVPLPFWANGWISLCNASGAWIASHGGLWVSQVVVTSNASSHPDNNSQVSSFPLYLSALAFGILAWSEWKSYQQEIAAAGKKKKADEAPAAKSMTSFGAVTQLAIPMTLNNLAGGVAGGAAGLTPELSATYALLASFSTMWCGHCVGQRLSVTIMQGNDNPNQKSWHHPSFVSALLLGMLSLMTLQEAMFGS